MKQAIINLLENAIRYSPIKGTIKIVGRQDVKGYMKISIIDEGPGISPEDIPIFLNDYTEVKSPEIKKPEGLV
ncbi:hypothetical protein F6Y04_04560 [Bacillus megaterium]|nr:hypothetical protein [Priestia megaterium]